MRAHNKLWVDFIPGVTLHSADIYGWNIMTLVLNFHRVPVKDPNNLLMASVVDRLIAQLINLGVEKAPVSDSGSLRQLCV